MSKAIWAVGGLRFWSGAELSYRDMATAMIADEVRRALIAINPAWRFERCEGPMLMPRSACAPGYDGDDLWLLQAQIMGGEATMRPETTPATYAYARASQTKFPACFWQVGKSYRRETNDGASAAKLRFFEFTQLEFQCIYSEGTKADYRAPLELLMGAMLAWLCKAGSEDVRIVPSDRLPGYSRVTNDVEILRRNSRWTEVCSISTRTDYGNGFEVLEIAVGLDRVVEIAFEATNGWGIGKITRPLWRS